MLPTAMTPQVDAASLVRELLSQMNGGTTFKAVSSTPSYGSYAHGQGGLFSYPGISKPVFSAMVLPQLGLQSRLPVYPSQETNPLYAIVTGVTAGGGQAEPNGPCDDPPTPGLMKLCMQTYVFGRYSRMTPVFELDRFGLVTNRGEFMDLNLLNQPNGNATGTNPIVPTIPNNSASNALQSGISKAMFEFAVAWARDFAGQLYVANPTNNTAGGGSKQYFGLDFLINTGYRDAVTSQLCPAADSLVYNFNGIDIGVGTNSQGVVQRIVDLWRQLYEVAQDTGLNPVKWVMVMRRRLFWQLTDVWPCAYNTFRCQPFWSAGQPLVNNPGDLIKMRDEMRQGSYLLIDGEQVEVVQDQAVAERIYPGATFESDIYIVPMTVLGGTPVTYMEYINYDAPFGAMEAARLLAPNDSYQTSDGGRFFWHKKPPTNFCVQMLAKTEPRLLLRTPQIAARLTNLRYTPLSHERDWNTNSSYFANGGRTNYIGFGPSFFTPHA